MRHKRPPPCTQKKQLPEANDSTLCQTPFGMLTPYIPSAGQRTISSTIEPSSLYVVTLTLPRKRTNVSSFVGCRCTSTTVPGSTAFKNRWSSESRGRACLDYAHSRQRKATPTDGTSHPDSDENYSSSAAGALSLPAHKPHSATPHQ